LPENRISSNLRPPLPPVSSIAASSLSGWSSGITLAGTVASHEISISVNLRPRVKQIQPFAGKDTSRRFLFRCYEFLVKAALSPPNRTWRPTGRPLRRRRTISAFCFPLIRAFTMKVRNHLLQPKCIAKRGAPRCACSVRIRHFAAIRAGPCVRVSGYFATEAP